MRIGIYDPYLDDLGGGEKYMLTLASCLAKFHSVTLFWDKKQDLDAFEKRFSISLDKIALEKNIFSPNVSTWERLRISRTFDRLIVLSDGSIPVTFSKKLFLHVQQPLKLTRQEKLKNRLKLIRVNKIFYNSQFTKNLNEGNFPGVSSTVIYPPVQLVSKQVKKENIILHVGRYRIVAADGSDYKKQNVMIDAFKKMIDQGLKDWQLIIVSAVRDNDVISFSKLQKSAKGYPVMFMINKTSTELETLYAKAKIYWHASGFGEDLKKNPELAEHFGISTVEAMSAGTVPVVLNAGGQTEIVNDSKDGFLWDTIDQLINKTSQLIKNKSLWQSVSDNAKERSKSFSDEKFCSNVNSLIT